MIMLTEKQQAVLDFICTHVAEHSFPPTRMEISAHFGFASPNAADCYLKELVKKGYITIRRGTSRGMKVIRQGNIKPRGIPEGWQLVPKDLTFEMAVAAAPFANASVKEYYKALLAAAPKVKNV